MHNNVWLIGRLKEEIQETTDKSGRSIAEIKMIVTRNYKNEDGIYESDIVPVRLYNMLCQHAKEYCHKGDLIGMKGRLQIEGKKMIIIADKITYLVSGKEGS